MVVTNGLGTNTSNPAFLNDTPMLMNEWSFNEPSGSTIAVDSIAGSNITLLGNTSLGGGVLTLPGGTQGDYAQFPNGIVSTESSITVETWFTDTGGFTWAVPWCFASTHHRLYPIGSDRRQAGWYCGLPLTKAPNKI